MEMIEKLFTSKIRVILLTYFLFEVGKGHLREISRKLKMPVSGVKREVDNLISLGILVKEGTNIIFNEECNIGEELKSILVKTDALIYPISKIFQKDEIDFALVFGSFARGDYKAGSDVDLMIIGNVHSSVIYKKIKSVESIVQREINPVILSLSDLKKQKDSGLMKDIQKKGFIMIKGDEDEFKKFIK